MQKHMHGIVHDILHCAPSPACFHTQAWSIDAVWLPPDPRGVQVLRTLPTASQVPDVAPPHVTWETHRFLARATVRSLADLQTTSLTGTDADRWEAMIDSLPGTYADSLAAIGDFKWYDTGVPAGSGDGVAAADPDGDLDLEFAIHDPRMFFNAATGKDVFGHGITSANFTTTERKNLMAKYKRAEFSYSQVRSFDGIVCWWDGTEEFGRNWRVGKVDATTGAGEMEGDRSDGGRQVHPVKIQVYVRTHTWAQVPSRTQHGHGQGQPVDHVARAHCSHL